MTRPPFVSWFALTVPFVFLVFGIQSVFAYGHPGGDWGNLSGIGKLLKALIYGAATSVVLSALSFALRERMAPWTLLLSLPSLAFLGFVGFGYLRIAG